ncbi:MAG: ABC transporter permease [Bacteroidetes bacterium]|nr:ABC transporter permease [Bacteroidota bacterium]
MLKNYFKIALRNLTKQKGLTFINIFGLSAGLACFGLFMLYAVNEFSFDRFHKNEKNIFRVCLSYHASGDEPAGAMSDNPMPLGPALKQDLPDVINYVRLRENWGESFLKADNKVTRGKITFADPSFFSVFTFELKSGNPATALQDLHSIVLTEQAAENLFGKTDPIGKTVDIKIEEAFVPFTVNAVAKNIPSNSNIQFSILGNFNYLATTKNGAKRANNWHQYSYQTYIQLKPGSKLPSDQSALFALRKKYYPDEEANSRKNGWTGKGPRAYFSLQPIRDIHTNTQIGGAFVDPVNPKTIWILIGIAAGVLLIACINFTTLAIGRSASRSREVGVRKVIGGSRRSLVFQFLMEALMLTIFSAILGLILAKLLLPSFNRLSGRELNFSFSQYPELSWLLLGLILIVALLAGSYPSFVLSGFKPVDVLKTKLKLRGSNIFTRSLVTMQFILSAGLIIGTIVILQQIHYMKSKNPGFNKDNVIVVDANGISNTKNLYRLFKQELSTNPAIAGMASAELGLGANTGWSKSGFKYNGKDKGVMEYFVDHDYINVLGLTILAGRNFDSSVSTDTTTAVIVNEAMVRDFGWTLQNAVGQRLTGYSDNMTPVVIGVTKNFNYFSFGEEIQPQMFQQFSSYEPFKFFVRINPGDPSKALSAIDIAWKKIAPDYPLKYSFLDENLYRFYESENKWSNIVGWAGGISIFLACLGLLGLAALAVVNRTKEIGIRKVLGASLSTIISLLSKDFLKLVIIAFVIAAPISWWLMNKWLLNYAYRIDIQWWVFAITAVIIVIVALFTVAFQAIRAASANPVKSLRSE